MDRVIHFGIFSGWDSSVVYLFFLSISLLLLGLESYRKDCGKKHGRQLLLLLLFIFYSAFLLTCCCCCGGGGVSHHRDWGNDLYTDGQPLWHCTQYVDYFFFSFLRPRNHPAAAAVVPLRLWCRHAPHLIHNSRAIIRSPSLPEKKKRRSSSTNQSAA
jgi:hypothetical protein